MKELLSRLLLLLAVLFLGAACQVDDTIDGPTADDEFKISGVTEDLGVVADGPVYEVSMEEHYQYIIEEFSGSNDEGDMALVEMAEDNLEALQEYIKELEEQAGANDDYTGKNVYIGYKYTRILYNSIDENNMPIQLSALVVWPNNKGPLFGALAPWADGLVIGCHITITDDKERPSNYKNMDWTTDVGMLAMAAKTHGITGGWGPAFENLVVIPDYQGYGISKDRIHPYLYQELTARQVVDGVLAGIEYYKRDNKFESDWKTISMGYSQGGSVALAVHKYIEQNNLVDKLRFCGSFCGDGPYDPVATVQKYVKEDRIYMPVAVGLILKGMVDANPYIRGKYTAADFFTQKFLDTDIMAMIDRKDMDTGKIQNAFLNYSKQHNLADGKFVMYCKSGNDFLPYTKDNMTDSNGKERSWDKGDAKVFAKASDVLLPEVFDWINGKKSPKHTTKMTDFEKAMNMNVLTSDGWRPQKRAVLIHSDADEVVPFENYVTVRDLFLNSYPFTGLIYEKSSKHYHVPFGTIFYAFLSDEGSARLFVGAYKRSAEAKTDYANSTVLMNGWWGTY